MEKTHSIKALFTSFLGSNTEDTVSLQNLRNYYAHSMGDSLPSNWLSETGRAIDSLIQEGTVIDFGYGKYGLSSKITRRKRTLTQFFTQDAPQHLKPKRSTAATVKKVAKVAESESSEDDEVDSRTRGSIPAKSLSERHSPPCIRTKSGRISIRRSFNDELRITPYTQSISGRKGVVVGKAVVRASTTERRRLPIGQLAVMNQLRGKIVLLEDEVAEATLEYDRILSENFVFETEVSDLREVINVKTRLIEDLEARVGQFENRAMNNQATAEQALTAEQPPPDHSFVSDSMQDYSLFDLGIEAGFEESESVDLQIDPSSEKGSRLRKAVTSLESDLQHSLSTREELQQKMLFMERKMAAEINRLTSLLESTDKYVITVRQTMEESLASSHSTIVNLQSEKVELSKRLATSQVTITDLEAEKAQITVQLSIAQISAKALDSQKAQLEDSISSSKHIISNLEAEKSSIIRDISNQQLNISSLESQVTDLAGLLSDTQAAMESERIASIKHQEGVVAELEQKVADTSSAMHSLTSQIRHLSAERDDLNQQLTRLTEQLGAAEARAASSEAGLVFAQEKMQVLESESAYAKQAAAEMQKKLQENSKSNEDLALEMKKLTADRFDLLKKNQELESKLQSIKGIEREGIDKINELTSDLLSKNEDIERLGLKFSSMEREIENLQSQANLLDQGIREREADIQTLQLKIEDLTSGSESLGLVNIELQESVVRYQQGISIREAKISDSGEKMNDLVNKMSTAADYLKRVASQFVECEE